MFMTKAVIHLEGSRHFLASLCHEMNVTRTRSGGVSRAGLGFFSFDTSNKNN